MNCELWILNHYATTAYLSGGYRHYWFSKLLVKRGYNVTVFCASFVHKGYTDISEPGRSFIVKHRDGIRFVFIKVKPYEGNGIGRIRSMVEYARGVHDIGKRIAKKIGAPDVILGSSVHPLACYEAIRLSRHFKCKNIVEIRDLWPESLIAMGYLRSWSLLAKVLYQGEKWLYKTCDQLIFTMEGGYQYILDKGWQRAIPRKKVHYINNGVDLINFDKQKEMEVIKDEDLESNAFKVVYAGSIAEANGIGRLIDAAKKLKNEDVIFLIYGDGDEKQQLETYCKENGISNICFKGRVEKKYIPYILCHADCHIVNYANGMFEGKHNILKYGGSHNKVPEYLASAKPLIFSSKYRYGVVGKYGCGLELDKVIGPKTMDEAIMTIKNMSDEEYQTICEKSREAAKEFDIVKLTDKLEAVVKELLL